MSARDDLEKFVRWVMRDVTFYKHYGAVVMAQAPDGSTVDVKPDDENISGNGLSGVPLDTIPGVDALVPPGARVTLYFENGSPQKPRCKWVEGTTITLTLAGGTMPVARVGDAITITMASAASPPGNVVTGVGIISGGSPKVLA